MWSRGILLEFWGGRHQKPRGGHSFSLYFNPEHQGPVLGDGNCLEELHNPGPGKGCSQQGLCIPPPPPGLLGQRLKEAVQGEGCCVGCHYAGVWAKPVQSQQSALLLSKENLFVPLSSCRTSQLSCVAEPWPCVAQLLRLPQQREQRQPQLTLDTFPTASAVVS